jgi:hypothetical protein
MKVLLKIDIVCFSTSCYPYLSLKYGAELVGSCTVFREMRSWYFYKRVRKFSELYAQML